MQKHKIHQNLLLWSQFVRCLRGFFQDKGFLECSTACLVPSPGTEPAIDFFELKKESLFLRSSPELQLKKILSMGEKKIFEIGPVFRRGENTAHHRPEFMMIEWYRAYYPLEQIISDVKELFEHIELQLMQENRMNLHFETHSIPQLFASIGHPITPETTQEEYKQIAFSLGLDIQSMETIDDYFFLIWTHKIEPSFSPRAVVFVRDYPPFQAAYAKINENGWANRLEVYWHGLELGNAFDEITDAEEQTLRFRSDNQKRVLAGRQEVPLDNEFLDCLKNYPPSVGIAMGVERLFMAFYKIENINEVKI